jgi:putative transposase
LNLNRRFQIQRQNHRLKDFDYSSPGVYFITINAQTRGANWFGVVTRDEVELNDTGQMVLEIWNDIPNFYEGIQIDAFVVMPDHVHGITVIESLVGADSHVRPAHNDAGDAGQTRGSAPTNASIGLSLPEVVQRFKTLTTNRYIKGVRELGWPPFEKHFWQRGYYERVLRNEMELETRRKYIVENPLRWELKNSQSP